MASWQDGPEYAPTERPAAFVTPPLPPLTAPAPPAPVAAPVEPGVEPSFVPAAVPQPDLATLVPDAAPGRNPNVAFEVTAAAITAGGTMPAGPGQAGGRLPTQPFTSGGPPLTGYLPVQAAVQPNAQVNPAPFPAPNTPQWFAPPPESRVPVAPPTVTVTQIWLGATPAVMITLILGALFSWLSILMLALSFALSARIGYRRAAVRRSYSAALIWTGVVGLLSLVSGNYDADTLFSALSGGAQFVCWILPIVIGLIVGAAIRAGERPDRVG